MAKDDVARKFEAITKRITDRIEEAWAGGEPLRWVPGHNAAGFCMPRNFTTGKSYRGINVLTLLCGGFGRPLFAGLGQIKKAGGRIRDGEFGNASWIFFWDRRVKRERDADTGEEKERAYYFARSFKVWNIEQTEGLDESKLHVPERREVSGAELHEEMERLLGGYVEAERIDFEHVDCIPHYRTATDAVRMPAPERFEGADRYYRTKAHELTHSTGHASRLDRFEKTGRPAPFGTPDYSAEELVAQLGAAFIGAEYGFDGEETIGQDAAYIASWLAVLRNDPRMIVDAASKAARAVEFIRERSGVPVEAEAVEAE